ncbi:hypothetical protein L1889_10960 [Paenalcaligenes niemegkensis]|uniref:hypothetical protein n=1 Tax=Paenalcaligenes niemegkensis TaxID=2895469 RepID=UPI001EE8F7E6|nr:hypothetical protein [Paenalcaligenes niemegkensis]MCQ9617152.1 hypothetical protein [Paenalcaligenes niemegkensis]
MHSVSRRAFFGGRRGSKSAWETFCLQLERRVEGTLQRISNQQQSEQARLLPKTAADTHHARDLCAAHGVCMALDGVPDAHADLDQPVLWVDPIAHLNSFQRLSAESPQWFVQPGCLVGELEAAGLSAFAQVPANLSVAAWLADRHHHYWPTGQTQGSGVVHASLLMADGSAASLGPFGTGNTKPLNCAALRKLVPELFVLLASPFALSCLNRPEWLGRYRLDALRPADGAELNLAHLLLGSGGDLGWVEWLVIDERLLDLPLAGPNEFPLWTDDDSVALQASEMDATLKTYFDPEGVFPHPSQDL